MAVNVMIHKKTFSSNSLFLKLNNKRLLTFLGSRFTPLFCQAGTNLYHEGDVINGLHVICSGKAAIVRARYSNAIFGVIDPSK
jgi:predicted thioredoxin/glutaredoxin